MAGKTMILGVGTLPVYRNNDKGQVVTCFPIRTFTVSTVKVIRLNCLPRVSFKVVRISGEMEDKVGNSISSFMGTSVSDSEGGDWTGLVLDLVFSRAQAMDA